MTHYKELGNSIWHFDSGADGPLLVISGGIHGNERTGIEVVNQLKDALDQGALSLGVGSIMLLHGNLEAIRRNERWSENVVDLNRCFGVLDGSNTAYEARRAQEIKHAIAIESRPAGTVYGVDIHATNKPSMPFLVLQPQLTDRHHAIVSCIPSARAILSDPNWVFTDSIATFDDYLNQNGNAAFCYETGLASDTSRIDQVAAEMVALGLRLGILSSHTKFTDKSANQHVQGQYVLREAIILTDAGFSYAPGKGEYTFQPFSKGECIAYHGTAEHIASFDGVFIFPKLPEHWKIHEPVGFLAEQVPPL